MNEENKGLYYYNQLRSVPEEAKKQFNNGRFSGTDINPMWRIKRMTEVFGCCGIGWFYEITARHLEKSSDGVTICAFVAVNLYVKIDGEWSKPIYGEGGNTFAVPNKFEKIVTSDEAFKMALTDAVSNATKQLGVGADIWFEQDKQHGTKYDQQTEISKLTEPAISEAVKKAISDCKNLTELGTLWKLYPALQANSSFQTLVRDRKKELSA